MPCAGGVFVVTPDGRALPVWTSAIVALQICPQVLPGSENACLPQSLFNRDHPGGRLCHAGTGGLSGHGAFIDPARSVTC